MSCGYYVWPTVIFERRHSTDAIIFYSSHYQLKVQLNKMLVVTNIKFLLVMTSIFCKFAEPILNDGL